MSTRQFYRKFSDITDNITPNKFIKDCRLEKAAELLKKTDTPIQDIIAQIGLNSSSYFYKEFTKKNGCTPKDYRSRFSS